jgi:voltage-gated potassium channel
MKLIRNKIALILCVFAGIILIGTAGYMVIEGWSFLDALFMTVITITTVGYNEVRPLSTAGRIFSVFLIIGGVGGALYSLTTFVEYMIEGRWGINIGRRHMNNIIAKMTNHFILCGYGRVGREIGRVFSQEGVPFVVIDKNKESIANATKDNVPYLEADATADETLKEAGIEQARGLVASLGSDADNTYIVLSAHVLRPDLFIEARTSSDEAEIKLKRAGASRIISPYSIGGQRMAMLALRPGVVDFIDTVTRRRGPELQMENLDISEKSPLNGLTVEQVRKCAKANILAINKKSGKLVASPAGDETISSGDRLIIMGTKEQLATIETVCEGVKPDEQT